MATQYFIDTSLDGFVAGPGDDVGWLGDVDAITSEEHRDAKADRFRSFFAGVGAMVMGSSSYRWVVETVGITDADAWRAQVGDVPVWVLTHRDLPAVPGVPLTFVRGDVADVHAQLLEAAGERNVWVVGGGEVAGQFADAGLLDELHLGIAPVTLGTGAPLLPRRLGPRGLTLSDVQRADPYVFLTYRVEH